MSEDLIPINYTAPIVPTLAEPLPIKEIKENANVQDTMPIELQQVQYVFKQIAAWWPQVSSIDDLGRMTAITFKAIEKRRDLLLLPNAYAYHSSEEENSILVNPLP